MKNLPVNNRCQRNHPRFSSNIEETAGGRTPCWMATYKETLKEQLDLTMRSGSLAQPRYPKSGRDQRH